MEAESEQAMSEQPREYTEDEVCDAFLAHVRDSIEYWHDLPDKTCRERMRGLAFSILSALDGSAMDLPAFIVAPSPHPDDKAFHQENDENWWPENHDKDIAADISGGLHELL